mgnify:FL=1
MAQPDDLRNEYRELSYNMRLMITLRVGAVSVLPVFLGGLVSFMWTVGQQEGGLIFRVVLPFSGFIGTLAVGVIERRLTGVYDLFLARGIDLEAMLDINDGMYNRLSRFVPLVALRKISITLIVIIAFLFFVAGIAQIVNLAYFME